MNLFNRPRNGDSRNLCRLLVYVTLMYIVMENVKERKEKKKLEGIWKIEDEYVDREFLYERDINII